MNSKTTTAETLILIDSIDRFRFFKRFITPLHTMGTPAHFITSIPSIKQKTKNLPCKVTLCKRSKKESEFDCNRSCEYLAGSIGKDLTKEIYASYFEASKSIIKTSKIHHCLIWNGGRTQSLGTSDACRNEGIAITFLELANLPGKIFADPKGVSSHSEIFQNLKILNENKESNIEEYDAWLNKYKQEITKIKKPKQVKIAKSYRLEYIPDQIHTIFSGIQQTTDLKTSIIDLLKRVLPAPKIPPNKLSLEKTEYTFFPMQLQSDSQLTLHSQVGNFEAIKYILNYTTKHNTKLVVKLHPAETDRATINHIKELQDKHKIIISDAHSITLIKHAKDIIVINSTVGLEATLMDKRPIEYLGKSIFKKMEGETLRQYILSYLIDVDYFSSEEVEINTIRRIIARGNS